MGCFKGALTRVFQLKGPLYGQRTAGYKFWETLCEWFAKQGFVRSEHDLCMFYNTETRMRVGGHVDDLITRGSKTETKKFWKALQQDFDHDLKSWD